MKIRFSITFLLLLITSGLFSQKESAAYTAAQASYQNGQYSDAIQGFSGLLAQYPNSADLYQQLGAAYYKAGQLGRAILAYEKALRLRPEDKDIRYNLKVVSAHQFKANLATPSSGWSNKMKNTLLTLGYKLPSLLALVFIWLTAYWAYRWQIKKDSRKQVKLLTWIALVIAVLLTTIAVMAWRSMYVHPAEGIITARIAPLREAPDEITKPYDTLDEGMKLRLLEAMQGYRKVALPNDEEGWIPETAVEKI